MTHYINVGDILESRDSRRKGKMVKVLSITPQYTFVETIRNKDGAIINSVGKTYNIKTDRILDDYRPVQNPDLIPEIAEDTNGAMPTAKTEDILTPADVQEEEAINHDNRQNLYEDESPSYEYHKNYTPKSDFGTSEEEEEPLTEEQVQSLHEALKSAGYYKLPDKGTLTRNITDALAETELEEISDVDMIDLVYTYITELD